MLVLCGASAERLMVELTIRGDIPDWGAVPRVDHPQRLFTACSPPTIRELESCSTTSYLLHHLDPPFDFLVDAPAKRRINRPARSEVYASVLPNGSLLQLDDAMYVVSPEFLMLLMARDQGYSRLLYRMFEFCGSYLVDAYGAYYRDRLPRTSLARTAAFLDICERVDGASKLDFALVDAREGAASPMESALGAMLSPPRSRGGYGLSGFEMNPSIMVADGCNERRPDIYYGNKRVAVEYDGKSCHDDQYFYARDRQRRNEMVYMGVSTISVAREQIYSVTQMDKVARILEKLLGIRRREVGDDYYARRIAHQREILSSIPRSDGFMR